AAWNNQPCRRRLLEACLTKNGCGGGSPVLRAVGRALRGNRFHGVEAAGDLAEYGVSAGRTRIDGGVAVDDEELAAVAVRIAGAGHGERALLVQVVCRRVF